MAVEVAAGYPLYKRRVSAPRTYDSEMAEEPPQQNMTGLPLPQFTVPPHYLHDLESVFWIALHTLYTTIPEGYDPKKISNMAQNLRIDDFFPLSMDTSNDRRRILEAELDEYLREFATFDKVYQRIAGHLYNVKLKLVTAYHDCANCDHDFADDPKFDSVYDSFKAFCDYAAEHAADAIKPLSRNDGSQSDSHLSVGPTVPASVGSVLSAKRSREEDSDEREETPSPKTGVNKRARYDEDEYQHEEGEED